MNACTGIELLQALLRVCGDRRDKGLLIPLRLRTLACAALEPLLRMPAEVAALQDTEGAWGS